MIFSTIGGGEDETFVEGASSNGTADQRFGKHVFFLGILPLLQDEQKNKYPPVNFNAKNTSIFADCRFADVFVWRKYNYNFRFLFFAVG